MGSKFEFDCLDQEMQSRYGEKAGAFLARRMASAMHKKDFIDNIRVADKAKPNEVEAYNARRALGCCGSHDDQMTYWPTGQTFLFGFNYGH